jgi:hypothetical protein
MIRPYYNNVNNSLQWSRLFENLGAWFVLTWSNHWNSRYFFGVFKFLFGCPTLRSSLYCTGCRGMSHKLWDFEKKILFNLLNKKALDYLKSVWLEKECILLFGFVATNSRRNFQFISVCFFTFIINFGLRFQKKICECAKQSSSSNQELLTLTHLPPFIHRIQIKFSVLGSFIYQVFR